MGMTMKIINTTKLIALFLFSPLIAGCSQAPSLSEKISTTTPPKAMQLKAELDALAPTLLTAHNVPSVGVAYIENGQFAWTAQYGLQGPDTPATAQTLYNIASMSKPITAEIALQLASKGIISLDEKMSTYWVDPDIENDPRHEMLTPRMALSHQMGFTNWRFNNEDGKLQFSADPGTKTIYSGEGYDYLGRFMEQKTGETFPDLARKYVFDRLDMPETSFVKEDWYEGKLAQPHGANDEWRTPDAWEKWTGADNVHTTPAQFAKFMISVIDNQDITPDIAKTRFDVSYNQLADGCPLATEHCPESVGFGLGWSIFQYADDVRVIMHDGSDWGERSLGFFVPDTQKGVIIFTNDANGIKVISEISKLLYPENEAFGAFLTFQAGQ